MIRTKIDLQEYLRCDKQHLGINYSRPKWNDDIWRFEIVLRRHEYYFNNKTNILNRVLCKYYAWRHHRLGVRLGFTVPVNVCGRGLRLSHYGLVVINGSAQIGDFCDIHVGVNIGQKGGGRINSTNVPIIGNHVWIGPGAKLFGKIEIADYCQIGANAVVNKSFKEPYSIIAGCPATLIKVNAPDTFDNSKN